MPPDPKPGDELEHDETETGPDPDEGSEDADLGDEGDGEDDLSAGDEAESEGGEAETGQDVEDEKPRKRTLSELHREEKRTRKSLETRAEQLERERGEERRLREAAERRAEDAERRANARQAQETAEQEAARLELMSPDEKVNHFRQKDREEHQREMAGVKFQIWDSTDRTEFRQLVRDDPLVARVKDRVEVEYEKLKAQGRPVSREILANQEIAKMVREGRLKAADQKRARSEREIRRETVRPPRTRSDVVATRTRRGEVDEREARRKRLEGVEL